MRIPFVLAATVALVSATLPALAQNNGASAAPASQNAAAAGDAEAPSAVNLLLAPSTLPLQYPPFDKIRDAISAPRWTRAWPSSWPR